MTNKNRKKNMFVCNAWNDICKESKKKGLQVFVLQIILVPSNTKTGGINYRTVKNVHLCQHRLRQLSHLEISIANERIKFVQLQVT